MDNIETRISNARMRIAYNLGIEVGKKLMEDKIQKHCEIGKPVLANGDLYFFQDSQEHLRELMDSFDQPREK